MGRHKRKIKEADERTFEVTVWNTLDGDIVKKLWDASIVEVAAIEDEFRDEPFREVQVEER